MLKTHKHKILLTLCVISILTQTCLTAGADDNNKDLGVSFDLSYMSRWMTKGKEGYGQQGAFFETIDFDFWSTGFGASVTHLSATSSGYVNKQRLEYSLHYSGTLFNGERYRTEYRIDWIYKHYYKIADVKSNVHAWKVFISLPQLFTNGLGPYYIGHFEYPAVTDSDLEDHWDGSVHRFGLKAGINIPQLPEQLNLSSEIAYTNGLRAADHDWSYATFGIWTEIKINEKIQFIPRIYHQISMDDSVCRRDVTYCRLSLLYEF